MSGNRIVSCLAVVLRESDEILLLRRRGSSRWTLPGGRLEALESWRACAARETWEETGVVLDPTSGENDLVLHCKEKNGVRVYYFACWRVADVEVTNKEPHQHDEVAWHRLDALPDGLARQVKVGLEAVFAGGGIIETGFVDKRPDGVTKKKRLAPRVTMLGGLVARLANYLFPPLK